MNVLSSKQFSEMTSAFRKTCGYADKLISDTREAFGTLDNVIKFSASGNVWFADGQAYIHNLNFSLYPTFLSLNGDSKHICLYKIRKGT